MQLRTVNFLLVLVTGRVWKGPHDVGRWMRPGKLWDCEEALSFISEHFIEDMMSEIINNDIKEILAGIISNEYFRN